VAFPRLGGLRSGGVRGVRAVGSGRLSSLGGLRSRLGEYRGLFAVSLLVVLLIAVVAVFAAVWPRYEEEFVAMGVLGEEGRAEGYYPNGDPSLAINSSVQWYLYLYNHRPAPSSVSVRVRVVNSTVPGPNRTLRAPCPAPAAFEVTTALGANETRLMPYTWRVSEASQSGDSTVINELVINGSRVGLNASSGDGRGFRMVLELWTYDEAYGAFRFGWESRGEYYCVWNQVWFNVTLPE